MLMAGFILGFISFVSWATIYHKLPEGVKKFCAKHSLLIDILTTGATYLTLGNISSSLVSAFAAAWVGLLFELYMFIQRNPEDFTWLDDMIDSIKLHLKEIQLQLQKYNKEYKERKLVSYGSHVSQTESLYTTSS